MAKSETAYDGMTQRGVAGLVRPHLDWGLYLSGPCSQLKEAWRDYTLPKFP